MKEVLDLIKPSRKEELEIKRYFREIKDKIKVKGVKIIMGGSSAKGTFLKGNHDIDIYVRFDPKKYDGLNISEILKNKLKFKGLRVVHGSRDYFQFEYKGYDIEIIPIMNIKKVEDAQNITDISPFHIKWVGKHKNLCDEIRLVKAFCKANGVYGAESFIKGFSGYALEILTVYYGGFTELLKAVSKWKPKVIIDVERYYPKGNILTELNKSKLDTPIVLIDPVQDTRNVTAVLTDDKFFLFKDIAKKYLRAKNKKKFFEKDEFDIQKIRDRHNDLYIFDVVPLDGKRDVVGAKLLKCYEFLGKKLRENEFEIVDSGWAWEGENAFFWYAIHEVKLSRKVKHYGPHKKYKDRLDGFRKRWGRVRYDEGISYVMKDRDFFHADDLFDFLVNDGYVGSKVSKLRIVK